MALAHKAAVLYHYPCPDGAFAALAAHLYHSRLGLAAAFFPNTVYSPLKVDDIESNVFDVIYLLDFIGPKGFALDICTKAKQVVTIDHHKTAFETLSEKVHCPVNLIKMMDMNKSGATLAFDYFTKQLQSGLALKANCTSGEDETKNKSLVPKQDLQRIKLLFDYIEDADLWKWNLPNSKAFSSGLRALNIDYNANSNASFFDQLLSLNPADVISSGERLLLSNQAQIDAALCKSFVIHLDEGRFGQCLAVEDDSIADLRSELGNQLALKSLTLGLRPIGAVAYRLPELDPVMLKVSLRGIENADTTEISQVFGGGGHRGASSFMIRKEQFDKWRSSDL